MPGIPTSAPGAVAIIDKVMSTPITVSNSSGRTMAPPGGSGAGLGEGGVFFLGFGSASLTIDDGFYTDNSSTGGPGKGRANQIRRESGAIMLESGDDTLQNVIVSSNEAMGTPTAFAGERGGGIALGAVSSFDSNAVVTLNLAQSPDENMFVEG